MKKSLHSIAMQLSADEIQEVIRLRKQGEKKLVSLAKKRDKIVAQLEAVDAEIAAISGDAPARRTGRRGRKPAAAPAKAKATKKKKRGARLNLSAAVRDVFTKAGTPLKAREVVDALPDAGVKVRDVAAMRKRVSVVLASQSNYFEQVERGVYKLKDE